VHCGENGGAARVLRYSEVVRPTKQLLSVLQIEQFAFIFFQVPVVS